MAGVGVPPTSCSTDAPATHQEVHRRAARGARHHRARRARGASARRHLAIIANEAQEPVKSEFRKIVELQTLGISIAEACAKLAQRVPATETNFFAIVIEIQSKAGGNLSEAIGNLSKTVRERKKMKGKISAMSMEALASAAIIGLVPFIVTGLLYMISPEYMGLLFFTIPRAHHPGDRAGLDEHRRGDDEEDDQLRFLTGLRMLDPF